MKHYYPDFAEFERLSAKGNTIPVYRQLLADAISPVLAYRRLARPGRSKSRGHSFLLESVVGGERIARYSFVGADPVAVFVAKNTTVTISRSGKKKQTIRTSDPLLHLRQMLDDYSFVHMPNLPRFCGGLVGYASYDMVRHYEKLGSGPKDDRNIPDMVFGLYRTMVLFDHVSKTVKVVCNAHVDGDPKASYENAIESIEGVISKLRRGKDMSVGEITMENLPPLEFHANFQRSEFESAVEKCREYIRAGDIFQVVLSQRLTIDTKADPFDIYRALRVVNPSPFMFMVDSPDATLVGSSPEILCRVEDGVVTNRPLAGTRPRGKTEQEDKALEAELLADPKERAEHIMLVDLARNDVGRVAAAGTIELCDLMSIERYSHVMHIVSDVKGKLAQGMTAFDALRAALPVGTVSGAPKVRAMQIIDELEPTRRGPYAGAVGYVDFSGNMDTCIALRTMVISGGKVYVQVGAGIVADSVPSAEYEETMNKGRAMFRAIQAAQIGFDD